MPRAVNVSLLRVLVGFTTWGYLPSILSSANAAPETHLPACGTGTEPFIWHKIVPSTELVWHDCYSGLQCARLNVPLNYSDPNGSQAAIAITRIRSSFPPDSALYRGPILVNPGGPGGSGVDLVVGRSGKSIATIVGPQFDVVGFDPRGIARSTPRVSFFEPIERALWGAVGSSVHVLNISADGVAREWARSKVTNTLAGLRQSHLLRHINTDQTARDMLRIVQAHGREKLQYWGFSYGSVLGSTFAAIFPDKIERLIIDGVVDVENYYETLWSTNLIDTNKTMQYFYDSCYAAGPSTCPFYAPSPKEIAQNLSSIYDSIRKRPIPVQRQKSYGLVDYNRLRQTVFGSLYQPFSTFHSLSEALSDLAAGKGERLFDLLGPNPPPECDCQNNDDPDIGAFRSPDPGNAIACNDGAEVSPRLEDFEEYFEGLADQSEWGGMWAGIRAACIGWPKFPKTHFRGPVTGNTSFPILLIGNTADPVTPLVGAKKVAKGFPGSVVLTQDGVGHCSLNAGPSPCTLKYIRSYLVNGTLPPPETICPVIGSPFSLPPTSQTLLQAQGNKLYLSELSAEDRELLDAGRSFNLERRVRSPLHM